MARPWNALLFVNELYEGYCLADPMFYDAPGSAGDGSDGLLATLGRAVPAGWTLTDNGVWLGVHPAGVELPEQGWKVHVSACLDNARRVLATTWDHCIAQRLHFKFLDTPATFVTQNAKYADRGGSGKFVTIYPIGDAELERTLAELGEALAGEHGPYILSDLRYGDGPLYVRYGGFVLQDCRAPDGSIVPAIRDGHGHLVPDERGPRFHVPSWVDVPDVLGPSLAAHDAEPSEPFAYDVVEALHYSNGGGVYDAVERSTGQHRVVLKEARPYAGLDVAGVDAVTRLRREHEMLRRLAGLDCVPAVHELRGHWEHTFLVEEHVDGPTLNAEMVRRHPLIHPDPSPGDLADYRDWALDVLDRLDEAVAAVHERGVVLGDLHPRNVLLRPDGRLCLIDLELAHDVGEEWVRSMGAQAFSGPPDCTGFAVDHHTLGAIRLWLFLSYTDLLRWDPDKADELVEWARDRFTLPPSWEDAVRRDLVVEWPEQEDVVPGWRDHCWPRHGVPRWEATRDSIAAGIAASATTWRDDRLFPGDPAQFHAPGGGLALAYGAAGVLWALAEVGCPVDPTHLDWLEAHVDGDDLRPGLYDGLAGIGLALDRCGRHGPSAACVERIDLDTLGDDHSLFSGTAGVGLALMDRGDASLATARRLAERGVTTLDTAPQRLPKAGLLYGWSGLALLLIRLAERSDPSTAATLLKDAERAIAADLARCVTADDTLQFDEGWRLLPYLGTGSAGVGAVLGELLADRPDSEALGVHVAPIRRAASTDVVVQCGVFNGRAGLVLLLDGDRPTNAATVRDHVARLAWHALPYEGHVAFAGDQLARMSMDLGTGTAGVLLALAAASSERPISLPYLRCGATR